MEAVAAGTLLPGAWRVAEQVKPVQMGGVGVRRQEEDVIINLEPDFLECKVKWASGNITMNKASGGDRIPIAQETRQKALRP